MPEYDPQPTATREMLDRAEQLALNLLVWLADAEHFHRVASQLLAPHYPQGAAMVAWQEGQRRMGRPRSEMPPVRPPDFDGALGRLYDWATGKMPSQSPWLDKWRSTNVVRGNGSLDPLQRLLQGPCGAAIREGRAAAGVQSDWVIQGIPHITAHQAIMSLALEAFDAVSYEGTPDNAEELSSSLDLLSALLDDFWRDPEAQCKLAVGVETEHDAAVVWLEKRRSTSTPKVPDRKAESIMPTLADSLGVTQWNDLEVKVLATGLDLRKTGTADWTRRDWGALGLDGKLAAIALLIRVAQHGGTFPYGRGVTGEHRKHTLHDLNAALREAFGLKENPLKAARGLGTQSLFAAIHWGGET